MEEYVRRFKYSWSLDSVVALMSKIQPSRCQDGAFTSFHETWKQQLKVMGSMEVNYVMIIGSGLFRMMFNV